MSAKCATRTRSIQTTITSSNNTVKVINVITDIYDGSNIGDVMESIKYSIDELNNLNRSIFDRTQLSLDCKQFDILKTVKNEHTSNSNEQSSVANVIMNQSVSNIDRRLDTANKSDSEEHTTEISDVSTSVKKYHDIDVDELFTRMLTDLINNMPDNRKFVGISELTQAINEIVSNTTSPDQYSFKISNMLLSMDPIYIKSLKDIFKSDVSAKMINILFPLNHNDNFIKCRCRRNIDGLRDKWVIKFK